MKEMLRMADKSKVDEVKQMLEYTQKGTAKATVGNYMVVLRNDPLVRESMKYNKLTGRIDIVKKLWWNEEICKLDDDGRTYFYYFFERYYKLTSEKCMDKALRIEANSRAYHPICEYLEQLEWDGQERIRYVLQRYMGADASDFVYEVVKHFLMEALSRIYRPGCKADEMLCLVGQQGAGKSTFFRFLALNDDWFSDDLKQLNDSKIYEHLRGHWIMEMSEMIAAISAKSNEEIKSFLTRQKDTYRNPYDKYEEDRKRQCIFAGSTNTRQFIPFDRTGARRFLPIAIDSSKAEKHILDDEKEARAYFDQLWAEAMEIYWSTENKSSLLKFSKEMEQKISEYRKQFTQEDTMAGMIQGWLDVEKGEFVAIVGTSGSGKSTLLHMLGGLDRPSSGKVFVDGKDIFSLKDEELTIFRRRKIGFVFQAYNLVPVLNVYENIVLPIELDGGKVDKEFVKKITETLGLDQRLDALPNQLSGGQQQRVAIARALAAEPAIILADEPTGNLDGRTSQDVLGLLKVTSQKFSQTIVMITHNEEIAQLADRIIRIEDGHIQERAV